MDVWNIKFNASPGTVLEWMLYKQDNGAHPDEARKKLNSIFFCQQHIHFFDEFILYGLVKNLWWKSDGQVWWKTSDEQISIENLSF